MKINIEYFKNIFNIDPSDKLIKLFDSLNLEYEELNDEEKKEVIDHINSILQEPLKTSGPHRIKDWNDGWKENCDSYLKNNDFTSLIPKYFGKLKVVRIQNKFVKSKNENFEYDLFKVLQSFLYEKYCSNLSYYYEFGCGTGHNLLNYKEICDTQNLTGLDWATSSQDCIRAINHIQSKKIDAINFDFENPNYSINIENNSAICTLAALEQIGDRHENFINFLINKKPDICLHLEPIEEVLDTKDYMENLSISYFKKRKYLSGFLTKLKKLEKENKIEILECRKTGIGSYFIEGYTLVVWRIK